MVVRQGERSLSLCVTKGLHINTLTMMPMEHGTIGPLHFA